MTLDEELAHNRLLSLQQYLDQVCANPVLRYSPELEAFLTDPDDELLAKHKPDRAVPAGDKYLSEKTEPVRVFDVKYPGGHLNLMMDNKLRAVTHEISNNVDKLTPLEQEAVVVCKEIHVLQDRLSKLYASLGRLCGTIAENYKSLAADVKFPNVAKLGEMYGGLQDFMHEHCSMVTKESKNFGDCIQAMFDFSLRELEGIKKVVGRHLDHHGERLVCGQLPKTKARIETEEVESVQDRRCSEVWHGRCLEVYRWRWFRRRRKTHARQGV